MSGSPVRHVRLTVAYDGTDFAGLQSQPAVRTVQDVLEAALCRILKESCRLVAAGRTDAGVHAVGQVIRVGTRNRIPAERLPLALNSVLPDDVLVRSARLCDERFHPRYDAVSRTYRYRIDNRVVPDLLSRRYAWHVRRRLDESRMQSAAAVAVGTHDFAAFCSAGTESRSTTRTLTRLACRRRGGDVLITVSANAFLYRMVRNLVGTLVEIGLGDRPVGALADVLDSRRREQCSPPAPPQGLVLQRVDYPDLAGSAAPRQG